MTNEQRDRVEKLRDEARTTEMVAGQAFLDLGDCSDDAVAVKAKADADALSALLDERDKLADALKALAFEVSALRIAEYEIRQAIGNTNWSALMSKRSEAAALLPAVSATRRE